MKLRMLAAALLRNLSDTTGKLTVVEDLHSAIGTDAFQSHHAGPAGFQLHQCGAQTGGLVTQFSQQLIAGHGTAQLCTCQTAASHDKLIEEKGTYYRLYTGAFELE